MTKMSNEAGMRLEQLRKNAIEKYAPPRDRWLPPDEALFGPEMLFEVPEKQAKIIRYKAIKYSFTHHYSKSKFYHRFCNDLEVKPEDIKSEKDFHKIPLISDIIFKNHPDAGSDFVDWLKKLMVENIPITDEKRAKSSYDQIIDILQNQDITLVFSSGTSGTFSFVPRDKITWDRQMYMCSRIFEFSPYEFLSPDYKIIWLGPNPRLTHLYIGRLTMMLMDLFDESKITFGIERELTTKLIKILMGTSKGFVERSKAKIARPFLALEEKKIMDRIISVLEKRKKNEEIVIGGTPFFLEMLMAAIEKRGLNFNVENGMAITAGGWKTFGGMAIPPDMFRKKIERIFGINQENCRDIYGMVESNALNISCEGHYKHIPTSIFYPMVLDEDSEPVGYGEFGRFAFLDPLANSYPGFIMTGDRVKILEHCPICNRPGPVIEGDVSRLGGVQDRGCGATLAKMFSKELEKQ